MTTAEVTIPPGPQEPYNSREELLPWMGRHFERFGDIFKASIYGTNCYVVRSPEYAEYVLRENWRNYVKGQAIKRIALLLGNGLMVSEGEFWKGQRRMIQPLIHGEAIAGLTKIISRANDALLNSWEEAARNERAVNVSADISQMVLKVILVWLFGEDYVKLGPDFNVLSEEATRSLEFAQTFRPLGRIILQIVERRRKQHAVFPDMLGMLMEARHRDTGRVMSDHQLLNEVMTLIVAGHETTASTLGWVWYLLSQNRDAEEKLSDELDALNGCELCDLDLEDLQKYKYARQVVEEALRLYPAGWLMTRRALQDDRIGDYHVPAGTEIYISPYFIQRHPRLWNEPDSFNPGRFGAWESKDRQRLSMLPFSAGPRNCVGECFARVEMQFHLIRIASRLRLRFPEKSQPELAIGVNLRSKRQFIMTPEIKVRTHH